MSSIAFGFLGLFSFVFLISIVVVIHELGHYWAGRMCGVHAEAFSMGFGPTLVSWRDKHGTVWRIAALPLGGYVKFLGDAGAASEPDEDKLAEIRESMGADADKCYHFKPIWQRSFITAAGPIANFILAITIFSILALSLGVNYTAPIVGEARAGTAAADAGFAPGDRILSIDGKAVRRFRDITAEVSWRPDELMTFEIERDGAVRTVEIASRMTTVTDSFEGERQVAQLGMAVPLSPVIGAVEAGGPAEQAGFQSGDRILSVAGQVVPTFQVVESAVRDAPLQPLTFEIERDGAERVLVASLPYRDISAEDAPRSRLISMTSTGAISEWHNFSLPQAIVYGADQTWAVVSMTSRYVSYVVTGRSPPSMLNGPLGIAEVAGQTAQNSVQAGRNAGESALLWLINMIQLAGFLSVGLGLVNLLPIPILDGGHLVYYAYEAVARRPLSMKAQAIGFRVGLALVLGMMLLATWNDINYKLSQLF
jgi:regulator of sigma E protease